MSTTELAQPLDLRDAKRTADAPRVKLPLLQAYLDDQQQLSAVERFALRHDRGEPPAQEKYYRELIPSAKPGNGQQYAFSVDLDRCTGCKACVTACRSLNGLDSGETWRAVGVLHGGDAEQPYQQSVTAACHHCVDPGCMKGCPVGAYEKDPATGIVKHLDDQCIGCQYCTLTCPYEVPQYNERLGIVRKCDLCSDRLSVGEAPACVQACPNEAISVRIVERAQAVASAVAGVFLPAAPSPAITIPTTEYRTKKGLPSNAVPADFEKLRPAAQHAPLVVTLVLTQLSFGAFSVDLWLGRSLPRAFDSVLPYHALLSFVMGVIALVGAQFHLGRPHLAYRAVLGLRTSWLSREIAAFGAFAGASFLYAASLWAPRLLPLLGLPVPSPGLLSGLQQGLGIAVAAVGALGVFCSAMIYVVTGRRYWGAGNTLVRFALSSALQGLATALLVSVAGSPPVGPPTAVVSATLAKAVMFVAVIKLLHEAAIFAFLRDTSRPDLRRTARLMFTELADWTGLRFGAGALGGVVLPAMLLVELSMKTTSGEPPLLAIGCFAFILFGEFAERALYFMSVSAPRMPGGVGT